MSKLKIKEKIYRKFNRKTNEYDRVVSAFEKYTVGDISQINPNGKGSWATITITGPKQTFILQQTIKPLRVLIPPQADGQPAQEKLLPLFFVTSQNRSLFSPAAGKIQGATHFALDGITLIPYKSSGRGYISPL